MGIEARFRLRPWGPMSRFGLALALFALVADQGFKWFMLAVVDIDARPVPRISVTPFFDLVLAWNRGVSYGLFAQHTDAGRWLLVAVSVLSAAGLWLWMATFRRRWPAAGVGLIIGGALANAADRILHGAVADFFWFHVGRLSWYVFNLADVAIVVGAAIVLLDSFLRDEKPSPGA